MNLVPDHGPVSIPSCEAHVPLHTYQGSPGHCHLYPMAKHSGLEDLGENAPKGGLRFSFLWEQR